MSDNTVIKLESVVKTYQNGTIKSKVLSNINLTISAGEFVSIIGKSGSGKSTLLNILGLLDSPTEGRYFLAGHDVTSLKNNKQAELRNRHIGYVFQAFLLVEGLTVWENIALPMVYAKAKEDAIKQRVTELAELFNMQQRLDHYPSQLSGGQQQRVAMARAVANNPTVLLVDEPTGNLDKENSDIVIDYICQLHQQGITIVLVTHDNDFASLAHSQHLLSDGMIEQ